MHNLFTMAELIEADPCEEGLDQLASGLGVYSGLTTVMVDDLEPMRPGGIIWGLRLLLASDHEQEVICVKVAVYAAELVDHLTNDDPYMVACLDGAKAWLDNPGYVVEVAAKREARVTATTAATATTATEWVETAEEADPTTTPKIKSYLIGLIRELS